MSNNDNNVSSCLSKASLLKSEGFTYYQQNNYLLALASYSKIFLWVNHLDVPAELANLNPNNENENTLETKTQNENNNDKPNEEQLILAKSLKLSANLNCCTCYLRLNKIEKSLEFAQKSLLMDPNNIRGIFRRGQCYLRLNDLDLANKDLLVAMKKYPQDKEILNEWQSLQEKLKKQKEKEKLIYSKMFTQ